MEPSHTYLHSYRCSSEILGQLKSRIRHQYLDPCWRKTDLYFLHHKVRARWASTKIQSKKGLIINLYVFIIFHKRIIRNIDHSAAVAATLAFFAAAWSCKAAPEAEAEVARWRFFWVGSCVPGLAWVFPVPPPAAAAACVAWRLSEAVAEAAEAILPGLMVTVLVQL